MRRWNRAKEVMRREEVLRRRSAAHLRCFHDLLRVDDVLHGGAGSAKGNTPEFASQHDHALQTSTAHLSAAAAALAHPPDKQLLLILVLIVAPIRTCLQGVERTEFGWLPAAATRCARAEAARQHEPRERKQDLCKKAAPSRLSTCTRLASTRTARCPIACTRPRDGQPRSARRYWPHAKPVAHSSPWRGVQFL